MKPKYADERDWLAQIVALLFSLAAMAQFAATASPRKRYRMLAIIRSAEAWGLRIAARYGNWDDDTEEPDIGTGNNPEHAIRLAVSLRAIALALSYQGRFMSKPDGPRHDVAMIKAELRLIATKARRMLLRDVPLIDTS